MMTDEGKPEGVYGENVAEGALSDERGIREETVEAHPQPTGDDAAFSADAVDSANDVKTRGAEAVEGSEGVAADLEKVREGQAVDAGSGGMGREGVPQNVLESRGGEYARDEDEGTTPG